MILLDDLSAQFNRCWLCGTMAIHTWPPKLCWHHIARGVHRTRSKEERCAVIRTCTRCHEDHLDSMPMGLQYAIKLLNDPEGYDRVALNRLRKRADSAVSAGEVAVATYELEFQREQNGGWPYPRWKP